MDIIIDALLDTAKLLPFLFLTYLLMEFLEHKTSEKTQNLVKKAGRFGPILGSALGAIPQCGFSAAASNFYAGRVITMGTLISIYLSTSDEMLPILISEQAPVGLVIKIVLAKAVIGMIAGLIIDFVICKKEAEEHEHIHDICEREHCHCEKGIVKSSIMHTLQIAGFILVVSLGLDLIIYFVGEDALSGLILNRPVIGPLLASVVGLIPNCAGSVVITQLYLENVIGIGSMMAGLLTGSGVGLLVLFRVNHDKKHNLAILGLVYGIGAVVGIIIELVM